MALNFDFRVSILIKRFMYHMEGKYYDQTSLKEHYILSDYQSENRIYGRPTFSAIKNREQTEHEGTTNSSEKAAPIISHSKIH